MRRRSNTSAKTWIRARSTFKSWLVSVPLEPASFDYGTITGLTALDRDYGTILSPALLNHDFNVIL